MPQRLQTRLETRMAAGTATVDSLKRVVLKNKNVSASYMRLQEDV